MQSETDIQAASKRASSAIINNTLTQETLRDANLLVERAGNKPLAYIIRARTYLALENWHEFVADVQTLSQYIPKLFEIISSPSNIDELPRAYEYLEQYYHFCFLIEQRKLLEKPSKKADRSKITQRAIFFLNQTLIYSTHPYNKEKYTIEKFSLIFMFQSPIDQSLLFSNSSTIDSEEGIHYLLTQISYIDFSSLTKEELTVMLEFITKFIPYYAPIKERILEKINRFYSFGLIATYESIPKENTQKTREALQTALEKFVKSKSAIRASNELLLLAELNCRLRLGLIDKNLCELAHELQLRMNGNQALIGPFKNAFTSILEDRNLKKFKKEDASKIIKIAIALNMLFDIDPNTAINVSNKEALEQIKKFYQENDPSNQDIIFKCDYKILLESEKTQEEEKFKTFITSYPDLSLFKDDQILKVFLLAKKYDPFYALYFMQKHGKSIKFKERQELLNLLDGNRKSCETEDKIEKIDQAIIDCIDLLIDFEPASEILIGLLTKKYQYHVRKNQNDLASPTLQRLVTTIIASDHIEQMHKLLEETHTKSMEPHADSIAIAYAKSKQDSKKTKENKHNKLTTQEVLLVVDNVINENAKKYWLERLIQLIKKEPSNELALSYYVETYNILKNLKIEDQKQFANSRVEFLERFITFLQEKTKEFTIIIQRLKSFLPFFLEKKNAIKDTILDKLNEYEKIYIEDMVTLLEIYPEERLFLEKLYNLLFQQLLEEKKYTALNSAIEKISHLFSEESFLTFAIEWLESKYNQILNLKDLQNLLKTKPIILKLSKHFGLTNHHIERKLNEFIQNKFNKAKQTLKQNKETLAIPLHYWQKAFPHEKEFFIYIYLISTNDEKEKLELILQLTESYCMQAKALNWLSNLYKDSSGLRLLSSDELAQLLTIANKHNRAWPFLKILSMNASKLDNAENIIRVLEILKKLTSFTPDILKLYKKVKSIYSAKFYYISINTLNKLDFKSGEQELIRISKIASESLLDDKESKLLLIKCEDLSISYKKKLLEDKPHDEKGFNKKLEIYLELVLLLKDIEIIENFLFFYEKERAFIRTLSEEDILKISNVLAYCGSAQLLIKFITLILKEIHSNKINAASPYLIFQLINILKDLNTNNHQQQQIKSESLNALIILATKSNMKNYIVLEPRQELLDILPIINIISLFGYQSAIYGGHLLDTLTNCRSNSRDIDIKTSMPLEEIQKMYPNGIFRETSSGEKTFQVFLPCTLEDKKDIKIDLSNIYTKLSPPLESRTDSPIFANDEDNVDNISTTESYDSSTSCSADTEIDNIPEELQEVLSEQFAKRRLLNTLSAVGLMSKNFHTGKFELTIFNPPKKDLSINFTTSFPEEIFSLNDIARMVFRAIRNSTRYQNYFSIHSDFENYVAQNAQKIIAALKPYEASLEFKNMFFSEYSYDNLLKMHEMRILQYFSKDLQNLLESKNEDYLEFLKLNLPEAKNYYEAKAILTALCREMGVKTVSFPQLSEVENLEKLEKEIKFFTDMYRKHIKTQQRKRTLQSALYSPTAFFQQEKMEAPTLKRPLENADSRSGSSSFFCGEEIKAYARQSPQIKPIGKK